MISIPANGTWEQRGGAVVRGLVTDLKLKDFQAAGIVGNLGYESGQFKDLHEGGQSEGQGGYGWAQWTAGRRIKFMAWCTKENLDWQSVEANYGYLVHEIKTDYKSMLTKLRKTTSIEDATFLIYAQYETPQEFLDGNYTSLSPRTALAKRALAGAGGEPVPGPPEPTPEPGPAPVPTDVVDNMIYVQIYATRVLQQVLGLKVDGDYGPGTRKAVQAYLKGAK